MSKTIMYKFLKNGDAKEYTEINNSWLGAMSIWTYLEDKYLPLYRPDCVKKCIWYKPELSDEQVIKMYGFKPSRLIGLHQKDSQEIWDLINKEDTEPVDRIILLTTMDHMVLRKKYFDTVIYAFEHFNGSNNSLKQQADVLKTLQLDDDCIAVAWNQCDVQSSEWESCYDEGDNEVTPNLFSKKDVYFMFENDELDELSEIYKEM